jgi:ESCRT-II complex subunit VPS22
MGALGHGYKLVKLGNKTFLQTVPMELSQDNTVVIQLAGDKSYTTKSEIMKELGWDATRADVALVRCTVYLLLRPHLLTPINNKNNLLCDGLAWIDVAPREEDKYWFPSVFFGSQRL